LLLFSDISQKSPLKLFFVIRSVTINIKLQASVKNFPESDRILTDYFEASIGISALI